MDLKNVTWNLTDLLKKEELEKEKQEIRKRAQHLESYKEQYQATIATDLFGKILKEKEELLCKFARVGAYANLTFAKKITDPKAQALVLQIDQLGAEISNQILFLSLRFKDFEEKNAQRLIKAFPQHQHYLERIREFKEFTLSEEVEKVITLKDITGGGALNAVYDTLASELTFKFQEKDLTQEELLKYVRDSNPEIRKQAYDTLLTTYQKQKNIISTIYQNIVQDWKNELQLRTYSSPISVRNKANDLEDQEVELLLKVFQKNLPLFRAYFTVKAKTLKMKKLRRYDIYAPFTKTKKQYTFPEAKKIVLEAFTPFPEFVKNATAIMENHIDSEIIKGKRSGAFCYGIIPTLKPYIMMSFTGEKRAIQTLAHELGHGIHDMLASSNSYFQYSPVLPLAETASTFAEIVSEYSFSADSPY